MIVSHLAAPSWCAAQIVIDRPKLELSGAQALQFNGDKLVVASARAADEDRPWSPKPTPRRVFAPASPSPLPMPAPQDAERDDALEVLGAGAR